MTLTVPNDDLYIGDTPNERLIDYASEYGISHLERIRTDLIQNEEYLKLYRKYIRMIGELLKELNKNNNTIETAFLIRRLILNGYISLTKFEYSEKPIKEIYSTLGANVVNGIGCCRHVSSFLKDIFKYLGYECEEFFCNGARTPQKRKYGIANHVIPLIPYKDVKYGFDILNDLFLRFIDDSNLLSYVEDNNQTIYHLKPYASLMLGISLKEYYETLERYSEYAKKPYLSQTQVLELNQNSEDIFHSNIALIENFSEATHSLKESISEPFRKK